VTDLILRADSLRRGIRLEAVSAGWMAIEALVAIFAGIAATSVLLTAFGADSVIELISALTLLWKLRIDARSGNPVAVESVERRAAAISAVLLVLLCLYVALTSIGGLILRIEPQNSVPGIVIASAAVIVMPWLAIRKRSVNRVLESPALRADIAESISCAWLAGVTLAGLVLDSVTGWWWLEYLAAIGLLLWLIPETREAIESMRGKSHGGSD
jgi:divalent metal cation (Fe/Co/Zn/Cd) transporter